MMLVYFLLLTIQGWPAGKYHLLLPVPGLFRIVSFCESNVFVQIFLFLLGFLKLNDAFFASADNVGQLFEGGNPGSLTSYCIVAPAMGLMRDI